MFKKIIVDGIDTGYTVSEKGKIFNPSSRIIGGLNTQGYMMISIKINGKERKFFIHRLVAENFVPNSDPDKKTDVHHIDGNKLNNDASNLEWISKEEHGILTYFEKETGLTRYPKETIFGIIAAIKEGELSPREIAKKFDVNVVAVHRIKNGESFTFYTNNCKDLLDEYNKKFHRKKREAERAFVFKLVKAGFPPDLIIRQIKDQFAYDEEEARYVYKYLLSDNEKNNRDPKVVMLAAPDNRFKYDRYIKDIENMILSGTYERKDLVRRVMAMANIDMNHADDLIRQRTKALINGHSFVSTIGREADVARLKSEYITKSNRREELRKLNEVVDNMLINNDDYESIVQYVRDSGLITGKTGKADNCRMQVTKRKFYLKNKGLLSN